jgi:hypothetical protein
MVIPPKRELMLIAYSKMDISKNVLNAEVDRDIDRGVNGTAIIASAGLLLHNPLTSTYSQKINEKRTHPIAIIFAADTLVIASRAESSAGDAGQGEKATPVQQ